jgi:hypothetical protein
MSTDSVIRSEIEFEVEQSLNMVSELVEDGQFNMTTEELKNLTEAKMYLELAFKEVHRNNERWD